MNDEIESLQGQVAALSHVITQMLLNMEQLPAAKAALGLAMEQEEQNNSDEDEGTPAATIRARNAILGGYVELLQAVSSRD